MALELRKPRTWYALGKKQRKVSARVLGEAWWSLACSLRLGNVSHSLPGDLLLVVYWNLSRGAAFFLTVGQPLGGRGVRGKKWVMTGNTSEIAPTVGGPLGGWSCRRRL